MYVVKDHATSFSKFPHDQAEAWDIIILMKVGSLELKNETSLNTHFPSTVLLINMIIWHQFS